MQERRLQRCRRSFPIATATEVFAQAGAPEKKDLKVGFIPITCATPIIMAAPMGFYEKQGLNVEVVKAAGWAIIRDKTINKELDAAHMLAPMPIAISLGVGVPPVPFTVPAIENVNGQAICLAMKHKDKRDPKMWKGFKLAVPFDYSNHNYLLRYYLAEHGIDPDRDLQIRSVPPPDMVANLRADNIDGFPCTRQRGPARRLRRRGLHPHAVERDMGRPSLLLFRREPRIRHFDAEQLRGPAARHHAGDRPMPRSPRTASRSPKPSRRRTTSTRPSLCLNRF